MVTAEARRTAPIIPVRPRRKKMHRSSALVLLSLVATSQLVTAEISQANPNPNKANCSCLCVVRKIAERYAPQLGSRGDVKLAIAHVANSTKQFIDLLKEKGKVKSTDGFESSNTASWVTEVFEGLERQFDEYKHGRRGEEAHFGNFTGEAVVHAFERFQNNTYRTIFTLQHLGDTNHDVVIAQIPKSFGDEPGYRIYQSSDLAAYNLRAWLSPALTPDIYERKDFKLDKLTECISSKEADTTDECKEYKKYFDSIKELFKGKGGVYDKYIAYFEDTDTTEDKKDFEAAWKRWGGGKLLNPTEFLEYLMLTAQVTAYLSEVAGTSTPFSKEIYDKFTELYGTTNEFYYPDLPADAFKTIKRNSPYSFEIRAVMLDGPAEKDSQDAACRRRAYIIKDSIAA